MTPFGPIPYPIAGPIRYPQPRDLSDTPKKRATEQLQLQLQTQLQLQRNCKRNYNPQRQVPSTCKSADVILDADVTKAVLAGAES